MQCSKDIKNYCQEATTVAEVLVEKFVTRFGVPLMLHSDQGRNFESMGDVWLAWHS